MVFVVRDHSRLSRPEVAGKIIKAKDFWAFKEMERALADAKQEGEQIRAEAKEEYEAERRRGYERGTEEARLEQSSNMVEIVSQTVEYFTNVESQMVDLVLDAVRKVVNDFDDRQRVTTVVKNCLDLVRGQKHLTLNVNPTQVDYMRSQVAELQKIYPSVSHIDVHPDAKLALDACVIESEIGIVEASLAGQLDALHDALSVVFEQKAAPEDEEEEDGGGYGYGDDDGDGSGGTDSGGGGTERQAS
ncbi:MAG TPA: HrpE/YscL family type III secretion apparatus protein [Ramlibacter sp.]|uniref:HrpE/YscL family type III secretion apparatus protein n=1 Tax=Ramlibacter sp. TaxID=1917967 RepID=UPI002BCCFC8E|nr:HrpE/YscL family type III secretion apparatus protein [Ramlibacter sp.]HVZ45017.1 HrpE/YscL family type III secretion apparatus protein [Ramlibacter sp.]